jgi:ESCRT-I complex subunit TSG101|uniref:Tumor susceptibility protein 101 n=1 Tax=Panagrolaimus sp. PS1159 TaxID=55785 RepID=A0AC35GDW3_9BILA
MISDDNLSSMIKQSKMIYEDKAKSDIKEALSNYTDLSPKLKYHHFPDNSRRNAICLSGTIPVTYRGSKYHIPIALYLTENHPYSPPYTYVTPTSNMKIKVSEHVNEEGRIFLPYLNEWRFPAYDTVGLLGVLTFAFQEKCPVFQVKNSTSSQPPATSSNPPYPVGSNSRTPYPIGQPSFPTPSNPPYPTPNSDTGYRAPYQPYTNVPTPPVPPPPQHSYASSIRASLITAIEERIANRLKQKLGKVIDDSQRLDVCINEMRLGQKMLRDFNDKADRDQRDLDLQLAVYKERKQELEESLEKYSQRSANADNDDIDTCIEPVTPLHRQIFENYAIDLTMDDLIYHLTDALKRRVISLQLFLTYVRQFSRKKFVAIVTMNKGRERAGLPQITE